MSNGNIVEIIGAVVDVEFPRESVPKIYDALAVSETGLTLEVQQQLGDGVVRTIAMGSSDGLKRGIEVNNTGAPIFHLTSIPNTPITGTHTGAAANTSRKSKILLATSKGSRNRREVQGGAGRWRNREEKGGVVGCR